MLGNQAFGAVGVGSWLVVFVDCALGLHGVGEALSSDVMGGVGSG